MSQLPVYHQKLLSIRKDMLAIVDKTGKMKVLHSLSRPLMSTVYPLRIHRPPFNLGLHTDSAICNLFSDLFVVVFFRNVSKSSRSSGKKWTKRMLWTARRR